MVVLHGGKNIVVIFFHVLLFAGGKQTPSTFFPFKSCFLSSLTSVQVQLYVLYCVSPCAVGQTPSCPSHSLEVHYLAAEFHQDGFFHGADCAAAAAVCSGRQSSPLFPKTSDPGSWPHLHQPQRQKETWLAWKT